MLNIQQYSWANCWGALVDMPFSLVPDILCKLADFVQTHIKRSWRLAFRFIERIVTQQQTSLATLSGVREARKRFHIIKMCIDPRTSTNPVVVRVL